jgi:hypothetical protein
VVQACVHGGKGEGCCCTIQRWPAPYQASLIRLTNFFFRLFLTFFYYLCLNRKLLFGFNSDFLNWFKIYVGFMPIYVEKVQVKVQVKLGPNAEECIYLFVGFQKH